MITRSRSKRYQSEDGCPVSSQDTLELGSADRLTVEIQTPGRGQRERRGAHSRGDPTGTSSACVTPQQTIKVLGLESPGLPSAEFGLGVHSGPTCAGGVESVPLTARAARELRRLGFDVPSPLPSRTSKGTPHVRATKACHMDSELTPASLQKPIATAMPAVTLDTPDSARSLCAERSSENAGTSAACTGAASERITELERKLWQAAKRNDEQRSPLCTRYAGCPSDDIEKLEKPRIGASSVVVAMNAQENHEATEETHSVQPARSVSSHDAFEDDAALARPAQENEPSRSEAREPDARHQRQGSPQQNKTKISAGRISVNGGACNSPNVSEFTRVCPPSVSPLKSGIADSTQRSRSMRVPKMNGLRQESAFACGKSPGTSITLVLHHQFRASAYAPWRLRWRRRFGRRRRYHGRWLIVY